MNRTMRRAARQIGLCAAALMLFCLICRLTVNRSYEIFVPIYPELWDQLEAGELRRGGTAPDVARFGEGRKEGNFLRIPVYPGEPGQTDFELRDGSGEVLLFHVVRVGPLRTVYDPQTGGFSGDSAVLIAVSLFWWAVGLIMGWNYRQARGADYYAYTTIYFAGFSIFALVNALLMTQVTVMHLVRPGEYSMMSAYQTINGAGIHFLVLTSPVVILFAVAMAVSNIVLLRHERPGIRNALGILVGVLLISGVWLGIWLAWRDFSGSEWEWRLQNTIQNVYATAFVYFECMLAGSVICGIHAARHQPAFDKDFIIILGCWFRKDGTLPPLLRGRADRAIRFWREQREATGREAMLIPSGGQGPDEPMPEAEAMERYLREQGIPGELIRPECASANTYQNMAFSRKIIEEIHPEGRTVFATTNYHVFRSGVWAAQAGLRAEGVGGKTKWWYWPNAFMRECVGLLARRWKEELVLMAALMAFFGVLTLVL